MDVATKAYDSRLRQTSKGAVAMFCYATNQGHSLDNFREEKYGQQWTLITGLLWDLSQGFSRTRKKALISFACWRKDDLDEKGRRLPQVATPHAMWRGRDASHHVRQAHPQRQHIQWGNVKSRSVTSISHRRIAPPVHTLLYSVLARTGVVHFWPFFDINWRI